MKVLIADPHALTRAALAAVVSAALPDVEVDTFETGDLAATLQALRDDRGIELVFVEPALPDATGLDALAAIRAAQPHLPVVVVSEQADFAFAQSAMRAGARAIVSKRWHLDRLRAAVRLVLVGGSFAPVEAMARAAVPVDLRVREAAGRGEAALRQLRLTPRQREVLAMLAEGAPNKVICRELRLAENTVKAHTSAIYRALAVRNRTQALAALMRLGITGEMLLADVTPAFAPAPYRDARETAG